MANKDKDKGNKRDKPDPRARLDEAAESVGFGAYGKMQPKLLRPDQIVVFTKAVDPEDPGTALESLANLCLRELHRQGRFADIMFSQTLMGHFETLASVAENRETRKPDGGKEGSK